MVIRNAGIVLQDGDTIHEAETAEILDNGWVKAEVHSGGGWTETSYFPKSAVERVYERPSHLD